MSPSLPSGRWVLLVLALCPAAGAREDGAEEKPPTPTEEYNALLKAHLNASSAGVAMSDEERLQFVGRVYRFRNSQSLKFLELAEKYPADPVALDALIQAVWYVNTTPWPVEIVGPDDARARAFALIERNHIRSDRLGPLCLRAATGFAKEYETFLRAVLEKNPHEAIRAQACLGLARFLSNRLERLDTVRDEPKLAKELGDLFGKDYLEALRRQDRARAEKEVEALFEEAAGKYGDAKMPDGGSVGEQASVGLFGVRNLVAGKKAPDIEGEDQDGKKFKLGDYRGKVVLLDFWQEA